MNWPPSWTLGVRYLLKMRTVTRNISIRCFWRVVRYWFFRIKSICIQSVLNRWLCLWLFQHVPSSVHHTGSDALFANVAATRSEEFQRVRERRRVRNNNNNKRDGLQNATHQPDNIMDLYFAVVLLIFYGLELTSQATKLLLSIRPQYELANREDKRHTHTEVPCLCRWSCWNP